MKKIIFCLVILFSLSTLAYAQGRPVLETGLIFSHPIYNACMAQYDTGETIGSESTVEANLIKVVINKKQVKATCRFTDISGDPYETDAEVGEILSCRLQLTSETENCDCEGGTGKIIVAANHGDQPGPGGSVTLQCTFKRNQCNSECFD